MSRYTDTLAKLYARTNAGIKLGLDCMQALCVALGRPEEAMRHVVVAGTNGKGSTSTLVADTLRAAGLRVGHFTSPHLLRFTERIKVDGVEISQDDVVRLAQSVLAHEASCERPPTFFEVVTAMALVHFREQNVDVAVLEVGLGGRLDATNIVPRALSVITPIGLDHQAYLGETIAQIAFEKAGIIAAQTPVVLAPQEPEAQAVFEEVAGALAAPIVPIPDIGERGLVGGNLPRDVELDAFPTAKYQQTNMRTASAAIGALEPVLGRELLTHFPRAVAQFRWPGRYEWLNHRGVDVLIDGAHNPAGIEALLQAMQHDPRAQGRPYHVIFTALRDRPLDMLKPFLSARSVHATPVSSPRSRTRLELSIVSSKTLSHDTFKDALTSAHTLAQTQGGFVLVTGSLLLAADALAEILGEPRDPPVDG